jgi:hypothetical protein
MNCFNKLIILYYKKVNMTNNPKNNLTNNHQINNRLIKINLIKTKIKIRSKNKMINFLVKLNLQQK